MESVNGKHLWVSDTGQGHPVAFVHGLGGTSMIYQPLVEALGDSYRTVRFDLEGHGRSSLQGTPTVSTWADDLLALLDAKGIERATIVGHSLGSIVAQRFAATYPERVDRLVLLGPIRSPLGDAGRKAQTDRAATVRAGGMDAIVDAIVQNGTSPATRANRPEITAFVRELVLGQDPFGYAAACDALAAADAVNLDAIEVEALLITGADDRTAPPDAARALAGALPKARVETLDDCGHWTSLERTSAVNHLVTAFI
jgi:pimeloyl-ACP methyl ester carboxylesterase